MKNSPLEIKASDNLRTLSRKLLLRSGESETIPL